MTTTTPAADAVREAFEQWARIEGYSTVRDRLAVEYIYATPATHAAWSAWEAVTARETSLAQQHALELLSLDGQAMERESALVAERNQLHAIVCQCLAALKNGSGAAPECSIEFLSHAPGEVAAHVGVLVAERDALRAHLAMSRALAAPAVEVK